MDLWLLLAAVVDFSFENFDVEWAACVLKISLDSALVKLLQTVEVSIDAPDVHNVAICLDKDVVLRIHTAEELEDVLAVHWLSRRKEVSDRIQPAWQKVDLCSPGQVMVLRAI